MPTITLTEPAPRSFPRHDLEGASGLNIARLRDAVLPLVDIQGSLNGDMVRLVPGTSVGTLRVGHLRIDVRPRLAVRELVTLIRYAHGGDEFPARSETAPGHEGLDELICRILAEELDMIRQRGVSRLYINRREDLHALRGRPDFLGSFPWNHGGMSRLACRFHELSCDTLDNQLVLATLNAAILLPVQKQTHVRLNAHRHAWHELATPHDPSHSDFRKARGQYSRLTEHYRLAHSLGELILNRQRPASLFDDASSISAGLALDMAELFERAVFRMLRDTLEPRGLTVKYQHRDHHALVDGEGLRYRQIRPDVLIFQGDLPVAVVDAKYKDYWEADFNLAPVTKIDNGDAYQLFFYASRLQFTYGLPHPPPAIIISPVPSGAERSDRPVIASRFRQLRYTAGASVSHLYLSLLPLTSILKELATCHFEAGRSPSMQDWTASLLASCPDPCDS